MTSTADKEAGLRAMTKLTIRPLEGRDVGPITAALRDAGYENKPVSQYRRYLDEQADGSRAVLVALLENCFAGYLTITWCPDYPPFQREGVPEIRDFNVLPRFRRQGIGTRLMDKAEQRISERSDTAGIGVGLFPDYGSAQRLYVLRGFVPDGSGLHRDGRTVPRGAAVTLHDDLALYLTKVLRRRSSSRPADG